MVGEAIDDFLTTAWAHKYGNLEAKQIALANASANEKAESYKIARAVGQRMVPEGEKDFMIDRSVNLLGQKTFGNRWFSMNEQERLEFSRRLAAGNSRQGVISYLAQRYGQTEAQNFDSALIKQPGDRINIYDPDLYKGLENNYLTEKIYSLRDAPEGSEEEKQRKIYERTKMLINIKTRQEIDALKGKLKEGNLSADQKREIERAINDAEIVLREVGGVHNLATGIGRWEGYLNSIKTIAGPRASNVVGSILNGDFFDPRKNKSSPVESKKIEEMPGVEIYVFKKDPKGNRVMNAYNEMGEALYYTTPRSLFRTFFYNGELFARGLYKSNEQLKGLLNGAGAGALGDDVVKSIFSLKGEELDKEINSILKKIKIQIGEGKLSQKDFERIEKLIGQSKKFKNLTKVFSMPARTKKAIEDQLKKVFDKPLRKFRASIVRTLLKNKTIKEWIIKNHGGKLLGEFVKNGGLQNLMKPLVSAIAGALGIALTPLASIAITIGVNIAMDLAGKIAKVFAQMMLLAIVGLLAVIVVVVGGVGSWKKWNRKTYSYNYVVPDTVNQCEAYGNQGYYIPPNGGGGDPGPIIPPDWIGAEDLYELYKRAREYVSKTYNRSLYVELALVVCPGGEGCSSINGYWCYSGDYIYCKIDKLLGVSDQTAYLLFVHELIHQIQGGDCPSMVREWGADYLSEGGGMYGCDVSTSACTPEEAVNAALCWDTSTACYRDVAQQVGAGACD